MQLKNNVLVFSFLTTTFLLTATESKDLKLFKTNRWTQYYLLHWAMCEPQRNLQEIPPQALQMFETEEKNIAKNRATFAYLHAMRSKQEESCKGVDTAPAGKPLNTLWKDIHENKLWEKVAVKQPKCTPQCDTQKLSESTLADVFAALRKRDYPKVLAKLYPLTGKAPIYSLSYRLIQQAYAIRQKGKGAVALTP